MCCRSFTKVTLLFGITSSVTVQLFDNMLFWRNFDSIDVGNIETMLLKLKYDSEFAIYTINEWSLNSRFVYVAYIDMFSPAFQ